jgi:hypothetical protein
VKGKKRVLIDSCQNGFRFRHNSLQQSRRRVIVETRLPSVMARPKRNRRNPERILRDARRGLHDYADSTKVFNA